MRHHLKLKNMMKSSSSALVLGTMALCVTGTALAQDASDAKEDEIIVTATRRAASVQDIPLNIAAVGKAQIQEQGFDDISQLIDFVPGINIADQGGRDGNRIVVRGLNADPISGGGDNGGGTVATYIGEIPLYVDLRLNDLDRVEILLGPQGTLYGAGTMGGAIRYIPTKPDFSDTMLEVRADAFSYKSGSGISTDSGFTFNKPISDSFAIRGSLDYQDDRGYIDYPFVVQNIGVSEPDPNFADPAARAANFSPIKDANSEEAVSGRIAARWQPNDRFDATLTYFYQQRDVGGRSISGIRGTVPTGRYESPLRVAEPNKLTTQLLSLEITADLGFAELTSATGYATDKDVGQRDQTDLLITLEYSYESFPTFTAFTFEDNKDKFLNQEVRLVSKGDHRYNWIVGAFYNQNKNAGLSYEFTPGYGAFSGLRTDLNDLEYAAFGRSRLQERALFGEFGYEITDAWQVTVGGRYYDYTLNTADSVPGQTTVFFPLFSTGPDFPGQISRNQINDNFTQALNQKFDGFLFKFNTSYNFSSGNMVYATVSEGYRIGASNGLAPCPDIFVPGPQGQCGLTPGQQFGPNPGDIATINEREYFPDTVTNYEIGAKTTSADGNFIFNASLYYIDWKNPQVSSASVNASLPITVNAGKAVSKGFELSSVWRLSDYFTMRSNYSYTDSKLTEDVLSLVRTITPPGFGTAFEDGKKGDRLPGSPKSQFSIFGSLESPLSNGASLISNIGYSWQGKVLSRTGGRGSSLTLPSYGRVNASIGYNADQWSLTAYVENLFNDFSESSVVGTKLFNQTISGSNVRTFRVNVLPPRTLGLRLRYRFN